MNLLFPSIQVASILAGASALQRWTEGDNQPQGLRANQAAPSPAKRALEERIPEAQVRRAVDPRARHGQEQFDMKGVHGREMRSEASVATDHKVWYHGGEALLAGDAGHGGEVEYVDDGSCERVPLNDWQVLYDFESGALPDNWIAEEFEFEIGSGIAYGLDRTDSWAWNVTGTDCPSGSCARSGSIRAGEEEVLTTASQLTSDSLNMTSDGILSFDMRCNNLEGQYCIAFLNSEDSYENRFFGYPQSLEWADDANPISFNITANTVYTLKWQFYKKYEADADDGFMFVDNIRFNPYVCAPSAAPSATPTKSPSTSPTTTAPSSSPTTAAPSTRPTKAPSSAPTVEPPHQHPHWYWAFDHLNQIFWRAVGNPH